MYKCHREFIEDILFNYYMISSVRENQIFCPIAYNLDKDDFNKMKTYGEILDKLAYRIMKNINGDHEKFKNFIGDFKYKEEILSLKSDIAPVFWSRYDSFKREDGGIFFAEFNYDKPCAQRETIVSSILNPLNNPNKNFTTAFKSVFKDIIYSKLCNRNITVAVLIDPCHYEEHHLSYLFKDLLEDENIQVIISGPKNFCVKNGEVYAFGKKIDVILRMFPTEYLYEVDNFMEILKSFENGKVLILNDPRIIICQAKSLFAYLWEILKTNPELLSDEEKIAIKKTLPYTEMFKTSMVDKLINRKDTYVIKAVFGRYSEEVYIGVLYDAAEWKEIIKYVSDSPKLYIVQEFCKIQKDASTKVVEMDMYKTVSAYGNFGMYMMNGSFKGISVRWSEDYITSDVTTWITPVGLIDKKYRLQTYADENQRKDVWKKINDKAMRKYEFTGAYACEYEYFSLDALIIKKELENEIKGASESLTKIFEKVRDLVIKNSDTLFPVIGIGDDIADIIKMKYTQKLCAIGRMDWVVDRDGHLKLLEFNCETPAGIVEAIGLSSLIKDEIKSPYENPNAELEQRIVDNFYSIIKDCERVKEIRNIAFLTSTYYEDWYNTKILMKALERLPYNFIIGNIYDGQIKNKKLWLYGTPIDAVYRYYPLDWFSKYGLGDYLQAFHGETLSINPPHTFVIQSKIFYALIFELLKNGFFNADEESILRRYIPRTALNIESLGTSDFCIKPFLGREGEGIKFNYEIKEFPSDGYIYQQKVYIDSVNMRRYSTISSSDEVKFPVLGAYIVDNKYAGLYTRSGNLVTDQSVIYVPTYIDRSTGDRHLSNFPSTSL